MASLRLAPALVTFAIPLRRPVSVADRKRLDEVLSLTLHSIYRQTHDDFRVLVAAAHRPNLPSFIDDRLEIVPVPGIQPETGTTRCGTSARGGCNSRDALQISAADT